MEVPRIRSDATAASPLRRVGAEAARPDGSGSAPRDGAPRAGTSAQQPSAPAPPRPDRPLDLLGRLVALLPDVGPGGVEPDLATLRLLEVAEGGAARADGEGSRFSSAALREILSRLVRPGGGAADLRARVRAAAGDPTALLGALQSGSAEAEGPALARLAAALLPGNPVPGSAVPGDALEALAAALARVGRAAPVQAGGAWSAWIQGLAEALASRARELRARPAPRARARRPRWPRGPRPARPPRVGCALIGRAARPPGQRADGCRGTRTPGRPPAGACRRARRGSGVSAAPRTRGRSTARPRAPGGGDEPADQPSFPDGAGLTVLHLFVRPDHDGSAADAENSAPTGWRVRLGLDLQAPRSTPARPALASGASGALDRVRSASTLERVRAAEGLLSERLAAEGQEVDLVLSLAAAEDLDLSAESLRIPAPEGESWMDLAG